MSYSLSIVFYLLINLSLVAFLSPRADRVFLLVMTMVGWGIFAPLLAMVDNWVQFAGGGDDFSYFILARASLMSAQGLWDLDTFSQVLAQPGYPVLISILTYFGDASLLTLKSTNLFLFMVIPLIWFRIAYFLEGQRFARVVFVAVLFASPLWYYFFFLFKDIVIVLLQSVFLWGAMQFWAGRQISMVFLTGISLFGLIFFRVPLILQDSLVLLAASVLLTMKSENQLRRLGLVLILVMLGGTAVFVASNPESLQALGIGSEIHALTEQNIRQRAEQLSEAGSGSRAIFPILYFLIETTIFSPAAWQTLDAFWLRGIMVLPWLLLVPPFLPATARWLVARPNGTASGVARPWLSVMNTRAFATPWAILVIFVLSSFAVSWMVGDTTRWRLPDLPAIVTLVCGGWYFSPRRNRYQWLGLWVFFLLLVFGVTVIRGLA